MDVQELRYFLTVCETLNYTKAANQLFVSRQALCQKIHKLEQNLGGKLFISHQKKLDITPLGKKLMDESSNVIQEFDSLEVNMKRFADQKSGTIKISMGLGALSFLSPDIFIDFKELYPEIHIQILENSDSVVLSDTANGVVNLGIVGATSDMLVDLDFIKIQNSRLYLLIHKNNPLAKKDILHIPDLKDKPFISFGTQNNIHNYLLSLCREHGFEPDFAFCFQDIAVITSLVQKYQGITWSAAPGMKEIPPELCIKELEVGPTSWGTYIITRKKNKESVPAKIFKDYLMKHVKDV